MEDRVDFEKLSIDEVVTYLKTDLKNGLTKEEVEKRIKIYGYNEVVEVKKNPFLKLAQKFWGLTAWMLEAVIILSFILKKYLDMYIVFGLLVFNAIIGFFQEQKAENAVETLKEKLQINAKVLRDGTWQIIKAKELVPGDIIRLRAGDFVPADSKIIEGEVEVDQSALTGESLTVSKKVSDLIYSGSIIKSLECTAVVVLTGVKTYFGKTTELVQIARPKLHAEKVTSKVVQGLLLIVGVALLITFIVSYFIGINLIEVLSLALVLLASSIPVALPAMFTISMAFGSMELVKKGVLVTRLNAVEDAATMDALCFDKTGTITENKLTVTEVIPLEGFSENDVLLYGALASQEANQDPIDLAILKAAKERNISFEGFIQKSFYPFDPKTRRTEAIIVKEGKTFKVTKGALNIILQITKEVNDYLVNKEENFAKRGYRTLAVAVGNNSEDFKIVGLVALYDMPRKDSKELIQELKNLHISLKMLTGDAMPIAKEIAEEVGIDSLVYNANALREVLQEDPKKALDIIEKSSVFAEVYPQDKFYIVKGLQEKGHIVGMTGDGINDAPSLKQAEVGIAVSNATDVAKSASSVVLTEEGLSNIVDLIKVGRMIYQRLLTWIFNKVIKTFQIVVFVVVAFLLLKKFIVSAFDVILLMFVIDFVTLSISTDNVRWSKKPDRWNVRSIIQTSAILGVLVVVESLIILFIGLKKFGLENDLNSLQTYSFAILFYFGIFTLFVVRDRKHFWNSIPSKPLLITVILDFIFVTILVSFGIPQLKPIPLIYTVVVILLSSIFSFVINDNIKYLLLRKME
ncbi:MAG: plasma-membrane proton-efflux P-type ATPase [Dictyoglomus sp. NZ13-RE01]|nr:MAG: plasma-membrane proton-efflux P-type ATPase [Dictyoglomus sp. NZ13-RE01]